MGRSYCLLFVSSHAAAEEEIASKSVCWVLCGCGLWKIHKKIKMSLLGKELNIGQGVSESRSSSLAGWPAGWPCSLSLENIGGFLELAPRY